MKTCISGTSEFDRVKECVRVGVIRRLDGPSVQDIELETLRREVRVMAKMLFEDQHAHDISNAEQQRLVDEVADEICAAGISGLSESLWEEPTDLPYRVAAAATLILLAFIPAGLFLPPGLMFSVLGTALISFLTLALFIALILRLPDRSIRLVKAQRK